MLLKTETNDWRLSVVKIATDSCEKLTFLGNSFILLFDDTFQVPNTFNESLMKVLERKQNAMYFQYISIFCSSPRDG